MSGRAYLQIDFHRAPVTDVPHSGRHLDQGEAEALHALLAHLSPAHCADVADSPLQAHLMRAACDKLLAAVERTLQPAPIRAAMAPTE